MRARFVVLVAVAGTFGVSACASFLSDFSLGEGAPDATADHGATGGSELDAPASGSDAADSNVGASPDGTVDSGEDVASEESPADDGAAGFLNADSDTVVGDDGAVIDSATGDVSVSDAGCLTWALGGVGVPSGTVASASSTYDNYVPARAIDGVLSTKWLADGYTGVLTLTFPSSETITGIRMAVYADPAASEAYTVTDGAGTHLGSATKKVDNAITIESAIQLTPGSYNTIKISVDGGASWVAINEVSLLTAACQ